MKMWIMDNAPALVVFGMFVVAISLGFIAEYKRNHNANKNR